MPPVRVDNDEEATRLGFTEQKEPLLILRMVWVVDGARQRIAKGAAGLLERETVAAKILGGLLGVPLKREAHARRLLALRRLTDWH